MTTTTVEIDTNVTHTFKVDADLFRQAALAAVAHVDGGIVDEMPGVNRVRIRIDRDAKFIATNRFTAVVAYLPSAAVELDRHDGLWTVDLFPDDVTLVCKLFKPAKDQTITLRVDLHSDGRVTITDASGLFDGKALTLPTVGHPEDFPDIEGVIRRHVERPAGVDLQVGPVVWNPDLLRRWAATAAQYGQPLRVEASGSAHLVTVGDLVVGLAMGMNRDDDGEGEVADRVRRAWRGILAT